MEENRWNQVLVSSLVWNTLFFHYVININILLFFTQYLKLDMHFISAKFKLTTLVTTYNYVIGQI